MKNIMISLSKILKNYKIVDFSSIEKHKKKSLEEYKEHKYIIMRFFSNYLNELNYNFYN